MNNLEFLKAFRNYRSCKLKNKKKCSMFMPELLQQFYNPWWKKIGQAPHEFFYYTVRIILVCLKDLFLKVAQMLFEAAENIDPWVTVKEVLFLLFIKIIYIYFLHVL